MPANPQSSLAALPDLHCACSNLRRASRLVTQLYGEEMGGEIEPGQFLLLTVLSKRPAVNQATLGREFGFDKATMSRNLQLMRKNGWLEPVEAKDGRERGYRVTRAGSRVLAAAKPGWARARARLRAALEPGEWESMLSVIGRVAEAAVSARRG